MIARNHPNIEMIKIVAQRLGKLVNEVAFLGGATTGLLITDPGVAEIRPTKDVDVIIEIFSCVEFQKLEEKLRQLGFKNSFEPDSPICRWIVDDIYVDVMPTNEEILGFSNTWYSDALKEAVEVEIDSNISIRLVTGPYFCATKIEAFYGRGQGDFLSSHDIEDIITIIDGRKEIISELRAAPEALKQFLSEHFKKFLRDDNFLESISAQFNPDPISQKRCDVIIERIQNMFFI